MEENKYVLKIYASKLDFESSKTQLIDILNLEQNLSISLFLDQSRYVKYCQSVDKAQQIITKMYIYVQTMKYTDTNYISFPDFYVLENQVKNFIKNLKYIEQLNTQKLKKIMFTSKYQHFGKRIFDVVSITKSNLLLVKELDYDLNFIDKNIKTNDQNLLVMLNRKLKLRANLLGFDNYLEQEFINNKIIDSTESKRFIDLLINLTSKNFSRVEQLNLKHRNVKLTSEFSLELQNFTLSKLFEATNANIYEVFNIIFERIIINDKTNTCLSAPSLDALVLYRNQNTFISFVELIKSMSKAIHKQFSKYYNAYEYAEVNEFESYTNFYFMLLICDVLLTFMVEDEQVEQIHKQITKILVDSLTYAFALISMCVSFSNTSDNNLWRQAQNTYNFDEVFIDEQTLDASLVSNSVQNLDGIKVIIGILSGIRMFQAFDKDAELIEVIENYYKMGSQNTVRFNLSKLNIDILNIAEYENMFEFLEKR